MIAETQNTTEYKDEPGAGLKALQGETQRVQEELQTLTERVADMATKMERLEKGSPVPAEWNALKAAVDGF